MLPTFLSSVRFKQATEVKHLGQDLVHRKHLMDVSWSPNDHQYLLNEKCKGDNAK